MTVQILIPCKPLAAGKSRLSPLLDAAARQSLCADLLRRTLNLALALARPRQCHLVSSDPQAISIATALDVASIGDPGQGLNPALSAARDGLAGERQADGSLLILPIDLPWATVADLEAVLRHPAPVVIAPDRAGAGTNVLCLSPWVSANFTFQFGAHSFARHREQASALERDVGVVERAGLAFDIDGPEDYLEWRRRHSAAVR